MFTDHKYNKIIENIMFRAASAPKAARSPDIVELKLNG